MEINLKNRTNLAFPFLLVVVGALLAAGCTATAATDGSSGGTLSDLQDIEQVRTMFNQDEGAVRLVLLLSAT